MARYRKGSQREIARFQKHNGNTDEHGHPTYNVDGDWDNVIRWPCELLGVTSGEVVRGRQVSATATYVLIGDYWAVKNVTTRYRIKIDGRTLGIVAIDDKDGLRREMFVQAKEEQYG